MKRIWLTEYGRKVHAESPIPLAWFGMTSRATDEELQRRCDDLNSKYLAPGTTYKYVAAQ